MEQENTPATEPEEKKEERLLFFGASFVLPYGRVSNYQLLILRALQKRAVPYYLGTVPHHVIQTRRRHDRVAKQQRKVNRG